MDAAVVDQGRLDDVVATGLQQAGDGVAEEVVADVAQVERRVGVRGGELDHDVAAGGRQLAEVFVRGDAGEHLIPVHGAEKQVEETLDGIVSGDFRDVVGQPLADGVAGVFRCGMGDLEEREHHEGVVAFEFLAGDADLEGRCLDISIVQRFDGRCGLFLYE